MASQWAGMKPDVDALGRLALLWDEFYKKPSTQMMAEIRLQESRFGLSPLDRSRLQWEVARGDEADQKRQRQASAASAAKPGEDLRKKFRVVNG